MILKDRDLLILLTNDDGIQAQGLTCLRAALGELGTVVTVAPSEERSATSHGLTLHHPIRVTPVSEHSFAVSGTPVDCVIFALQKIVPRRPDLVVSGINHGANLGDDVHYSGTVAAAREAALSRIPALAVSLVSKQPEDFDPAAVWVRRLIEDLYPHGLFETTYLNVNIPHGRATEYRYTRQGSKRVASEVAVQEKEDPRGRAYYWIGQDRSEWQEETDSDYQAVRDGYVSITPLQRDQTDYSALRTLQRSEARIRAAD